MFRNILWNHFSCAQHSNKQVMDFAEMHKLITLLTDKSTEYYEELETIEFLNKRKNNELIGCGFED